MTLLAAAAHLLLSVFAIALAAAPTGTDCTKGERILSPTRALLSRTLLSQLDTKAKPWLTMQSYPDYFYLGSTPREMALGLPPRSNPVVPKRLKALAEKELDRLRAWRLHRDTAQFEIW